MKKTITFVLLLTFLMNTIAIPVDALENDSQGIDIHQDGEFQIITIVGEENIRRYQEEKGEVYDPKLFYIQKRVLASELTDTSNLNNRIEPKGTVYEYVVRNKVISSYTDFSYFIFSYRRPAGTVIIDESVSLSIMLTKDDRITIEILEKALSMSVQGTYTFRIQWQREFDQAVIIRAYPVYQKITGEVWEDDVLFDDKLGAFTVLRPIGDEIYVYYS